MDTIPGTYVTVKLFGVDNKLMITKVNKILEIENIERYLNSEQYGILLYNDESILIFDLRDIKEGEAKETGTVIITDVLRKGRSVTVGFVVNYLEEYVEKFRNKPVENMTP